jgi:ribosomal protein S19E (S16A)
MPLSEPQRRALRAARSGTYYTHPAGGARYEHHRPGATAIIRQSTLYTLVRAGLVVVNGYGRLDITDAGREALAATVGREV